MKTALFLCVILASAAAAQDGAAVFEKHCALCHRAGSETRAPLRDALAQLSRQRILASLATGTMKEAAAALTAADRRAVTEFLSKIDNPDEKVSTGACPAPAPAIKDLAGWNGWGVDLANSRFQPAKTAGLARDDVPRLKLKWAFGFPNANAASAQPAVAAGRVFVGGGDGSVFALDARSGCTYWSFKAAAMVRTAISLGAAGKGRYAACFGDQQGNVYALDAQTGALLWKTRVEDHPWTRLTGSPVFHAGRLYVPVSSHEEVPAGTPTYQCCTFRGSVVALDASTGKQLWKTYTIPDPPKPTKLNTAGTQMHGPAGAAIWSAPTLDPQRKVLYVATGNSYTEPDAGYSDAIIALDMDSGSMLWVKQVTPNDTWNFSCASPNRASCADTPGPDFDFGSSPMLRSLPGGKSLLVVGQKSGIVHALDPDEKGKIVWQTRVGRGGMLGGIEFGTAADDQAAYVALSDQNRRQPELSGGMFALRIATGEKIWHTPPPKPPCLGKPGCTPAQQAAVTLIPGVAFSGSMDGHLRAFDATDGTIVWDFDTLADFPTVNGVKARGGSLNGAGPAVAAGMLFVNSGYGILGGIPGNVLLAFSVDGK